MSSIDERIVKMTFDNDKFESGVKTTMSTLDKLKEKLTFKDHDKAFKNLETSVNNVNFSGIESGVEALQKRFSTLGIVGMEVTKRITNAAIDAGKRLLNATIGQAKQGGMTRALNIEQAKFQLKGLKMDVEEIMKNADTAVTGTAYGLDEAAKAASVLGASGVKAGEEMTKVLTSIAGAAAMTGRSYSDIADIYATVASNGRLMTEQLRQFSHSGLNVTAILQEAFGKTGEEIQEMVKKGEISFADFSAAMEDFGKHAQSANKTFSGSLANMKSAISRIGQLFTTTNDEDTFGYIENMRHIFNNLQRMFKQIKVALEPFAKQIRGYMTDLMKVTRRFLRKFVGDLDGEDIYGKVGPIVDLIQGLVNIFNALVSVLRPMGTAFREAFPNATFKNFDRFSEIIANFRKFTETLSLNKKQAENVKDAYKGMFDIFKLVFSIIKTVIGSVREMLSPFGGLLTIITSIVGFAGRLVSAFVGWINKTGIVTKVFGILTKVVVSVFKTIKGLVTNIKTAFDIVSSSKPVVLVIEAISSAFKFCKKHISALTDKFKIFSKKIESFVGSGSGKVLSKAFDVLAKALDWLGDKIEFVISKLKELFNAIKGSKAFNSFVETVSRIKNAISDWLKEHDVVKTFLTMLSNGLQAVAGIIVVVVGKIKEFASSFVNFLKESGLWEKFVELLKKGFELLKEGITESVDLIKDFGKIIGEKMQTPMEKLKDVASLVKDKIKAAFELKEVQAGIGIFSDTANKAKSFGDKIVNAFDIVKNAIKMAVDQIKKYVDKFKNIGSDAYSFISGILSKINFEKIAQYFPYEAFGVFLLSLSKFISNFTIDLHKITDSFVGVVNAFKGIETSISGLVNVISERLKPNKWKERIVTLLAFAGAIMLLALAIKMLSSMNKDDLAKGLATVAGLMVTMSLSLIAIGAAANKFKGANFAQIGIALIGIAGAVLLLQAAVKKFGEMDPNVLSRGAKAVAVAVFGLAIAVSMMQNTNFNKVGIGLLLLVLALSSLTSVIKKYNSLDSNTFAKGMGLIVASIVVFAIGANIINNANLPKTAAGLLVLNLALLALVGVMKIYSKIKANTFAKGMGLITVVLVAFAAAAHMLNGVDLKGVSKGLFGMVTALAAVSGLIWFLGKMDMKKTIAAAASLAGVLIAMSIALKVISKEKNILRTAGSLVIVAAALGLIGAAVYLMGQVPFESIISSLAGLSVLVLAMAGALKIIGDQKGIIKSALSLVFVAAGISMVAVAISSLSSIPFANIIASLGGLSVLVLAMAGALKILDGQKGIIKSAVGLTVVAAGLFLISSAIYVIAQLPFASLITSMVGLAALLVIISASLYALGNTNGSTIKSASSIIMISAAMLILAGALLVLSQIPTDKLVTGCIALAGALLVLVVAGFAATGIAPGLYALSVVILAIGVSTILVAASVLIFAEALATLSQLGPEAADSLTAFLERLAELAPRVMEAAITIGTYFIAALIALVPQIAVAGVLMIMGLLTGIAENIGKIAALGARIIVEFINGIARMIGPIIDAGILLMLSFIIGLADGIRNNSELFFGALKSLVDSMLTLFFDALQSMADAIPVVGKKISKGLEGVKESMHDAFDVEGTDQELKQRLDENKKAIEEAAPGYHAAGGSIKEALKGSFDGLTEDMSLIGEDGVSALLDSIANGEEGVGNAGLQIDQTLIDALQSGEVKPGDVMDQLMGGYNESLTAGGAEAQGNAKDVNDKTVAEFGKGDDKVKKSGEKKAKSYAAGISPKDVLSNVKAILEAAAKAFSDKTAILAVKSSGTKTVENFAKGISDGKSKSVAAGKAMATNASDGAKKVDFAPAGIACCAGFLSGLNNSSYAARITARGTALGNMAYNAAKKAIDSNSPSKKFRQLGIWANEGFIIGLGKLQNRVYAAGYAVGENAIEAVSEPMKKVYDILNQDLNMNPTITPVLDLSNVNKGINQMDNMLDTRTLSASVSNNLSGVGMTPAYALAGNSSVANNTSNVFNITVDGTENPEAFADRLVKEIQIRSRMS